jgi:DNA-binding transcriptional LysR family regulator
VKIHRKNDLNIRHLEVFEALMRCRTTVSAAEELGISQPAVSNAIKALEKQVGFALFERANRILRPTEDARLLLAEVEPVFAMLRSIETEIRDLRAARAGRLRLSSTPPLGHAALPEALRGFLADRPGVTVRYDVRRMETVLQSVESGAVDVGFALGIEEHRELEVIPLHRGAMVAVMPADHPLAKLDAVTPRDLSRHTLIGLETNLGALVRAAFAQEGVQHKARIEARYCHTACILAGAGIGVSVVDPYSAGKAEHLNVAFRPFLPAAPVVASAIVRSADELSKVAAAFIGTVRDHFAETASDAAA